MQLEALTLVRDIKNVNVIFTFSNKATAKVDVSTIKTETDSTQGFQRFIADIHLNGEPLLSVILEDGLDVSLADERNLPQIDTTHSVGFASVAQLPLHLLNELALPALSALPQFLQQGLQNESASQTSTINGDFWFDFSDLLQYSLHGDVVVSQARQLVPERCNSDAAIHVNGVHAEHRPTAHLLSEEVDHL